MNRNVFFSNVIKIIPPTLDLDLCIRLIGPLFQELQSKHRPPHSLFGPPNNKISIKEAPGQPVMEFYPLFFAQLPGLFLLLICLVYYKFCCLALDEDQVTILIHQLTELVYSVFVIFILLFVGLFFHFVDSIFLFGHLKFPHFPLSFLLGLEELLQTLDLRPHLFWKGGRSFGLEAPLDCKRFGLALRCLLV